MVDSISAIIILQDYMQSISSVLWPFL
jgi:RNase H-fold protein (predicted Holliday junction resolvase)